MTEMERRPAWVLYAGTSGPILEYLRATERAVHHLSADAVPLTFVDWPRYDWLVSCGYRHLFPAEALRYFDDGRRAINCHISYLPWNRGAYPNPWAFYDGTPHGVTVHQMDPGIDTGPILVQERQPWPVDQADWAARQHLDSTYRFLMARLARLFTRSWPSIRDGKLVGQAQTGRGTYHSKAEFDRVLAPLLGNGWRTPVSVLVAAGEAARAAEVPA